MRKYPVEGLGPKRWRLLGRFWDPPMEAANSSLSFAHLSWRVVMIFLRNWIQLMVCNSSGRSATGLGDLFIILPLLRMAFSFRWQPLGGTSFVWRKILWLVLYNLVWEVLSMGFMFNIKVAFLFLCFLQSYWFSYLQTLSFHWWFLWCLLSPIVQWCSTLEAGKIFVGTRIDEGMDLCSIS